MDRWIRIHAFAGDMIVLVRTTFYWNNTCQMSHSNTLLLILVQPAGLYHRFSTDEKNYAHVMRLFQGDPVWTPWNRGVEADSFPERSAYIKWLNQNHKA